MQRPQAVDHVLEWRRVQEGARLSVRIAANRYRLPPSTVQAAMYRRASKVKKGLLGRKRALTNAEVQREADTILIYADRGHALNNARIALAISTFIKKFPAERRVT